MKRNPFVCASKVPVVRFPPKTGRIVKCWSRGIFPTREGIKAGWTLSESFWWISVSRLVTLFLSSWIWRKEVFKLILIRKELKKPKKGYLLGFGTRKVISLTKVAFGWTKSSFLVFSAWVCGPPWKSVVWEDEVDTWKFECNTQELFRFGDLLDGGNVIRY